MKYAPEAHQGPRASRIRQLWLYYAVALLLVSGCATDVRLNAPFQDIWAVYGVLNLSDSVQYVRVSKAFLPESDANQVAASQEFTVAGLRLSLQGGGNVWNAVPVDTFVRDSGGEFRQGPLHLYRFNTAGGQALKAGEVYTLHVAADSLPGFWLSARARVPVRPTMVTPAIRGRFNEFCLPVLSFEDSVEVIFRTRELSDPPYPGFKYEVRVRMNYREDGQPRTFIWGPTPLFSEPRRCNASLNRSLCYMLSGGTVMRAMQRQLNRLDAEYTYNNTPICAAFPAALPRNVEVEVTAVDTTLSRYIAANLPIYTDYTTVRQPLSNIQGSQRAVGIFGAIAVARTPAVLSDCGEWLLRLNSPAQQPWDCE